MQAAAAPHNTGHEVAAVLWEEVVEQHSKTISDEPGANHRQSRWLTECIHQTYGHPLVQDVNLAEHRS